MHPKLVVLLLSAPLAAQQWTTHSGGPEGVRYSPLTRIDRSNVARLRTAWTYRSGDAGDRGRTTNQTTPVVVDGVMYVTTPSLKVAALNPATGAEIWRFDPFAGASSGNRGVSRGVSFWTDGAEKRLFLGAGTKLHSIDARTGKPDQEFGDNGSINLALGLDRDPPGSFNGITTPGVIYRNLIIVGASVGEGPRPSAPGHVRAYNVKTGKREWIFHTIPHPGEFGHDTWQGEAWKTAGGANDWGGMSVDAKRGLVFVALGSPAFDFYGGQRLGQNVFGNSVVALEAATGKRVWHFQTTHHDVWDYDLPCLPLLVTVKQQGRSIDAVAQVTKTGMVFVLDRETGKPLFGVEERSAPPSDLPGEKTSPTQPFPLKPPPFSRQGFTENDVTNISPQARAHVLAKLKSLRAGPIYTPPSRQGTVVFPGFHGGGLWGGAAVDAATGWLYVNSNNVPWVITMVDARQGSPYPFDHTGYNRFEDEDGYPAVKPPWGQLTAIDLNTGEIAWQTVLGEHKELTAKGVPKTGTENIGGAIVTAGGLVFIAATRDEMFRAFDKTTGKVLWETQLDAAGYATPATYELGGRQYVAIAAGGGGKGRTKSGDAIIAFSLP